MPEYVNWLRHASPYINAHRDRTFVVMLPGDGVEHPNFGNIVHDLVLLHSQGVRLVLVHGSRPQIESRLAARGLTPQFHRSPKASRSLLMASKSRRFTVPCGTSSVSEISA